LGHVAVVEILLELELDETELEEVVLRVGAKVAFCTIAPQALDLATVGPSSDFR
jgi:4-diphosphocytidyl-2C-methyl-D-erythritol kinase